MSSLTGSAEASAAADARGPAAGVSPAPASGALARSGAPAGSAKLADGIPAGSGVPAGSTELADGVPAGSAVPIWEVAIWKVRKPIWEVVTGEAGRDARAAMAARASAVGASRASGVGPGGAEADTEMTPAARRLAHVLADPPSTGKP
ncbi:hypothetical protein BL253_25480 [Pseudofrankia asymbiotica]|uniref:Uncharacterized protein n=1 Tax=Pseudofrankia asymbiotica TaxID=1834516 RepID=A0A1V2I503_9ACTN|nr:hypothetical protein BL253_25480 [Pseudofrankia asymbiotica]